MKSNKLVLIRHGESQWNLENRFTGWTDVNLTKKGEREAEIAGQLLRSRLFKFDFVYTSVLKRAIQTMKICLNELKNINIPISYDWRLNERHYGALQGLNKAETSKKYGDEQVLLWRRSYDTPPPKLEIDDKRHPKFDLKYNKLKPFELPSSESLKDTFKRVVSLWENDIFSKIKSGQKILIVAHGNSLRALVKYIDDISDKNIIKLNIPTGIPLVYELDIKLNPVKNYYLNDKNEIEENEIYLPRQDNTN